VPVPLPSVGSIILLHDLPHVVTGFGDSSDKADSARYGRLLGLFTHPVVMICSGIGGKDDMHYASRSFLPESARDVVYLETVFQAGATPIAITKALQRICTLEAKAGNLAANGIKKETLQSIAESAMGDVRHAVIQLQLTLLSETGASEGGKKAAATAAATATARSHDDGEDGKPMRRDLHTSSLHTVAKLANAQLDMRGYLTWGVTPDSVIASTDMDAEMVFTMLQAHVLPAIEASCKCEESAVGVYSVTTASAGTAAEEASAPPDIEQAYAALAACSDIAMLMSTKYDSNAHLDRAIGNAFPDEYVSSITCRFPAVSRGVGALERTARAKERGGKGTFLPVRRPPILDVKAKSAVIAAHLYGLGCDLAQNSASSSGQGQGQGSTSAAASAMVPSTGDIALNIAPILGSLYRSYGHLQGQGQGQGQRQMLQRLGPRVRWRLGELSRLTGHHVVPGANMDYMAHAMLPLPAGAATATASAGVASADAMEVEMEDIVDFDD